MVSGTVLK
jgi:hypothetical protein